MDRELEGTLDELVIRSQALLDNPLGDPADRPLLVYLPPGYDEEDRRYPTVYVIQGYSGHVAMWDNRAPWRPTFPQAADRLFATGGAPPCIVVFPDAWTRYGGSQFVDSPMLRPDLFGALASHAGDALYELCYVKGFGEAARALRDHHDGSYDAFLEDFWSRPAGSKPDDMNLIMTYGVAACFSADDDGTVRLPFDVGTGRLVDEVWQRWLDWDPVRMVPRHADALRSLKAVWLDAGTKDEWFLDLGMQAVAAEMEAIGVPNVRTELFDATHMGIDYRYPLSLAHLARHLTP